MPRKEKTKDQLIAERCCLLAKAECANYYNGLCLTDDGKCHLIGSYPTIHDGKINCDWFLEAVLPRDKELSVYVWSEIFRDETLYEDDETEPVPEGLPFRHCAICRNEFFPKTYNHKFCMACRTAGKRKRDRIWRRKNRHGK